MADTGEGKTTEHGNHDQKAKLTRERLLEEDMCMSVSTLLELVCEERSPAE